MRCGLNMTNEELNTLYQLGGVLVVVAGGGFASLRWVVAKIKELPSLPTETRHEATTIVTADTVAMHQLAQTIEALNVNAATVANLITQELTLLQVANALATE